MSFLDLLFNPSKFSGKATILSKTKPETKPAEQKISPEKVFFSEKGHLNRWQLRQKLEKDSGKIPGSGITYNKEQRQKIEKDVFGDHKFDDFITLDKYKGAIKELDKQRYSAKTSQEKTIFERRINYLKKLSGGK